MVVRTDDSNGSRQPADDDEASVASRFSLKEIATRLRGSVRSRAEGYRQEELAAATRAAMAATGKPYASTLKNIAAKMQDEIDVSNSGTSTRRTEKPPHPENSRSTNNNSGEKPPRAKAHDRLPSTPQSYQHRMQERMPSTPLSYQHRMNDRLPPTPQSYHQRVQAADEALDKLRAQLTQPGTPRVDLTPRSRYRYTPREDSNDERRDDVEQRSIKLTNSSQLSSSDGSSSTQRDQGSRIRMASKDRDREQELRLAAEEKVASLYVKISDMDHKLAAAEEHVRQERKQKLEFQQKVVKLENIERRLVTQLHQSRQAKSDAEEKVVKMMERLKQTDQRLTITEEKLSSSLQKQQNESNTTLAHSNEVKQLKSKVKSTEKKLAKTKAGYKAVSDENESNKSCIQMLRKLVEEKEQEFIAQAKKMREREEQRLKEHGQTKKNDQDVATLQQKLKEKEKQVEQLREETRVQQKSLATNALQNKYLLSSLEKAREQCKKECTQRMSMECELRSLKTSGSISRCSQSRASTSHSLLPPSSINRPRPSPLAVGPIRSKKSKDSTITTSSVASGSWVSDSQEDSEQHHSRSKAVVPKPAADKSQGKRKAVDDNEGGPKEAQMTNAIVLEYERIHAHDCKENRTSKALSTKAATKSTKKRRSPKQADANTNKQRSEEADKKEKPNLKAAKPMKSVEAAAKKVEARREEAVEILSRYKQHSMERLECTAGQEMGRAEMKELSEMEPASTRDSVIPARDENVRASPKKQNGSAGTNKNPPDPKHQCKGTLDEQETRESTRTAETDGEAKVENQAKSLKQEMINSDTPAIAVTQTTADIISRESQTLRSEKPTGAEAPPTSSPANGPCLSSPPSPEKVKRDERLLASVPIHIKDMYQKVGFFKDRKLNQYLPVLCLKPFEMPPGPAQMEVLSEPSDFLGVYVYGRTSYTSAYQSIKWFRMIPYKTAVEKGYHKLPPSIEAKIGVGSPLLDTENELMRGLELIKQEVHKETEERTHPFLYFQRTGEDLWGKSGIENGESLGCCKQAEKPNIQKQTSGGESTEQNDESSTVRAHASEEDSDKQMKMAGKDEARSPLAIQTRRTVPISPRHLVGNALSPANGGRGHVMMPSNQGQERGQEQGRGQMIALSDGTKEKVIETLQECLPACQYALQSDSQDVLLNDLATETTRSNTGAKEEKKDHDIADDNEEKKDHDIADDNALEKDESDENPFATFQNTFTKTHEKFCAVLHQFSSKPATPIFGITSATKSKSKRQSRASKKRERNNDIPKFVIAEKTEGASECVSEIGNGELGYVPIQLEESDKLIYMLQQILGDDFGDEQVDMKNANSLSLLTETVDMEKVQSIITSTSQDIMDTHFPSDEFPTEKEEKPNQATTPRMFF
ncbi:expressed unknown protein [Seminavis robusta]|uniref:Uncharacterized protein n=1 Tax=Seminavis robusta TaxID=568900 RepID=A0A9N8HDZ7_9STRA|nr:expressed unknown protein [Seminavis robusta]|eukprot:Sro365_g127320.1 n/a (1386) ;mRNA; r:16700-20857